MTWRRTVTTWLLAALVAGVVAFAPLPHTDDAPTRRHFRIEASSFRYTPATIAVNVGDSVTIELVATDVVHGLYVDGYDVKVTADPGRTASLAFVAQRAGMFRMRCSVTCGSLHPFMIGKLRVGRNELIWRSVALTMLIGITALSLTPARSPRP
jgi:plastocyanin